MAVPAFLHSFARPALGAERFTTIVRGDGAVVWDDEGREYVDALASLWYCNAGHGRDEIVDAVADQMRDLAAFHTFERFTNEPADALCERLAGLAPMHGARVFLTSGGSEAVDSAIKIARVAHAAAGAPERTVVLSRRPSYHGVTFGALAATGLPSNQDGFGPMLGDVEQVPLHDLGAMADAFERHSGRVAALFAEPVVGAGGVHPPDEGELAALRALCDDHGAFLVLDEVICGFGRLGAWWGASRYDVEPDLVTFAKAVTSGYQPVGGVLVGAAVRSRLEGAASLVLRHGHTYSGHPAACAAALANLAILEREGLVGRADEIGGRLSAGLHRLLDAGAVAAVRGAGAVWAVDLHDGVDAVAVRDRMMDKGVIARPLGATTVAFCPPLVIDDSQLDLCVAALETVLAHPPRSDPG